MLCRRLKLLLTYTEFVFSKNISQWDDRLWLKLRLVRVDMIAALVRLTSGSSMEQEARRASK